MVLEKFADKFTRYEIARILGARSLQLAMDAPILLKLSKEEEEELNYDTLKIAEKELENEVLPITVRRPLPKKSAKVIKKLSEEEIKEKLQEQAKKIEKEDVEEVKEEKEASDDTEAPAEATVKPEGADQGDEIMEMATPEDEVESGEDEGSEEF